jgi:hypothetical protein
MHACLHFSCTRVCMYIAYIFMYTCIYMDILAYMCVYSSEAHQDIYIWNNHTQTSKHTLIRSLDLHSIYVCIYIQNIIPTCSHSDLLSMGAFIHTSIYACIRTQTYINIACYGVPCCQSTWWANDQSQMLVGNQSECTCWRLFSAPHLYMYIHIHTCTHA